MSNHRFWMPKRTQKAINTETVSRYKIGLTTEYKGEKLVAVGGARTLDNADMSRAA